MVVIMGRGVIQLTLINRIFQMTNTSENMKELKKIRMDRWDTPGGWETTGRRGLESSLLFPSPTRVGESVESALSALAAIFFGS